MTSAATAPRTVEWRRQYPAKVGFRVQRITAREDLVVVEVLANYDGGPWNYGVQLLEFRDDKVARERIYGGEAWEAPEWRAPGARTPLQTRWSEAPTSSWCPGPGRGRVPRPEPTLAATSSPGET